MSVVALIVGAWALGPGDVSENRETVNPGNWAEGYSLSLKALAQNVNPT